MVSFRKMVTAPTLSGRVKQKASQMYKIILKHASNWHFAIVLTDLFNHLNKLALLPCL